MSDFTRTIPQEVVTEKSPQSARFFPVPSFDYVTENQDRFNVDDFRGKIVLIHFWATWCAPCVTELPRLIRFAKDHQDYVHVIAVSSDRDAQAKIRFLKKIDAPRHLENLHFAHDPQGAITRDLFQTTYLPETIVVDQNGSMVDKIVGDADWQSPDVARRITGLFMPQDKIKNDKPAQSDQTDPQDP